MSKQGTIGSYLSRPRPWKTPADKRKEFIADMRERMVKHSVVAGVAVVVLTAAELHTLLSYTEHGGR